MALTRLNTNAYGSTINLASNVTGTLPITNGGTAATTAAALANTGNLVLIKTTTASDVSNVIFDNDVSDVVFDDAYKGYLLNIQRAYGATNDQKIRIITRISGSDSTSAFRAQSVYNTYNGSTSTDPASAPNNDKLYQIAGTIRTTSPEYFQGQFFFYGIGTSTRMMMTGQCGYKNNSGYHHNEAFSSGADNTETTTGIKIDMASGNIYGTFSLYGIKT